MSTPAYKLDLGAGHRLMETVDTEGHHIGYIIDHPNAKDPTKECGGSLWLDTYEWARKGGRPMWHIEQAEPLTLTPSVLCTACGDHGFVRNGKWVPA